jgi:hypothetical protein
LTACFKLVKALRQNPQLNPEALCTPCVYFTKNLDKTEYPLEKPDCCGLGFFPEDEGCNEMRTNNCSARKR